MARSTRSANAHQDKFDEENEKPNNISLPANKAKVATKKRKRTSGVDSDDLPIAKQPRSDDEETTTVVKDEETQTTVYPPFAGDMSLKDDDAQKILDILDMVDAQGLLDRVFPLDDVLGVKSLLVPSNSRTPSDSYSLRTLLKESNEHPLRVYRSAIKQLFPISSQPRSRISPTAAQQLRFCQLALSLVEQASQHTIDGLSLKPEHVLPERGPQNEVGPIKDESNADARRKYALVQSLPTGEWWTSLNSDLVGADAKPLKDISTAHAELVAILPSSSSSSKPLPSLGDLHAGKKVHTKLKPLGPRHVSCGSFLDYGPFASFAPSFDNDGGDVGRMGVSHVLWRRYEKGKTREKARILGERMRQKLAATAQEGMEVDDIMEVDHVEVKAAERQKEKDKQKDLLESLLKQGEPGSVQQLLDALSREENVSELLEHNANSLVRLEELQRERLGGKDGGSSDVQIGSEEWEIAQKIMDSLTLLASLRPRLPDGSTSAIAPPASVLRSLHQTLPSEPAQGWYGTLTESRGLALRDDTTLLVKTPLVNQASVPAPVPAPVPQTPVAAYPPAQNYAQQPNYSYSGYSHQYRGTSYPSYGTQGQPSGYFPSPYSQGVSTPQAQKTQPSSYQPPNGSSSQYPYSSWYASYQATANNGAATPGPSSRRGTPQPAAVAPSTTGSGYAPYSTAFASATPARAVTNTVAAKAQSNGWATSGPVPGAGFAPPTLPPHMRPTGGQGLASPITPVTPLGFGAQPGYQQVSQAN